MSREEYRARLHPIDYPRPIRNVAKKPVYVSSLPNNFDWRSEGVISPVRDQGACGDAAALAVLESFESAWGISHSFERLSLQELIQCNGGCGGSSDIGDLFEFGVKNGNMPPSY
jgi:cysteine peptidase B